MQNKVFQTVVSRFLIASLGALVAIVAGMYLVVQSNVFAVVVGYLLSFFFIGSNFLAIRNFKSLSTSAFNKRFFISVGVRFLLALVIFVVVLKAIKIHQIYFTVSFLISYIFHSVIEIISINKLLGTDN